MVNFNILEETKRVLEKNNKVGSGYNYTAPALPKYPHQWLWDSCFAAIILWKIDPERAKREIKTLLAAQKENGFIPSMIFWENQWMSKFFSRITQLPILALAAKPFLDEVRPRVEKYYRWLEKERDFDGDGLVSIIHPWEATDASPAFINNKNPLEIYLWFYQLLWNKNKKFRVKSVMFNCFYAQGWRILGFAKKADRIEEAILKNCYDKKEEFFFDIGGNKLKTIAGLFPLILKNVSPKILDHLVNHLINPGEFWPAYPVPSVAMDEKSFDPDYHFLLWRGPTWINTNWFLIKGLERHGYKDVALQLKNKTVEMVEKCGLWEFYNPFTGKGGGQKDYTWSGLVLDLI